MVAKNAAAARKEPESQPAPQRPATDTLAEQNARRRVKFINDPQFQLAEQYRQQWIATIAADHTLEDILRPDYWRNVATKLRHYAHIECYAENGSFYCELLVVGKTMNTVRVATIKYVDLNAEAGSIDMGAELANYRINYKGPTNGHCVVFLPTNAIIKDRLMSEDAARTWLLDYLRRPDKGFMEDRATSEPIGEVAQPDSSFGKLSAAAAARKAGADA